MSYNPSGLRKIADLGFASTGSANVWVYSSSDAHATVEGANYFFGCAFGSASSNAVGMQIGDIVIVRNISTAGTSACTLHAVSSISTSTSSPPSYHPVLHATISAASS
ncbi:hypothetical protein [Pseudogulbenkiania subflava]|uniref:hypothetical protein n=1 Tax=Pseudogulbenkiania subflava TaxID=451637 RepID=UPI000A14FBE2|nr:hypothetical protein [Pseudogulbenkiania subflava]